MKEALVYLYDQCSYGCHYCMLGNPNYNNRKNPFSETMEGIERMVKFFDSHGKWNVFLSGGEPTEHPLFIELVEKLTVNHIVRIDTNNSMSLEKLKKFASIINVNRIEYIHCSLHEIDEGGERLKHYIDKLVFLQNRGFKVFSTFVATKQRIAIIPRISKMFKQSSVPLVIVPFRSPDYPKAYTLEERKILDQYMVSSLHRGYLDIDYRMVKGEECRAENTRVNIDAITGKVHRCWRRRNAIGDMYENKLSLSSNPIICEEDQCTYYFEPNLRVENLVKKDIEKVLESPNHYDEAIYRSFISNSK